MVWVILASLFGLSLFSFYRGMASEYGIPINETIMGTETALEGALANTSILGERMQTKTEESKPFGTVGGVLLTVTNAAFSIVKLPFEMINIITTALESSLGLTGIPRFVINGILSIVVIVIVFLVLNVIFRRDNV